MCGCPAQTPAWGGGGKSSTDTDGGGSTGDDTGGGDTASDTADTADTVDTADSAETPVGTGYDVGDVAYDLEATDANGDDWSLYSALGSPIVLVVGHMDYPDMVSTMDALPDVHRDSVGAVIVALVGRNEYSTYASEADAVRWQDAYDLDVALIDPLSTTVDLWSEDNSPRTYVIGRDMGIVWVSFGAVSASDLITALESAP